MPDGFDYASLDGRHSLSQHACARDPGNVSELFLHQRLEREHVHDSGRHVWRGAGGLRNRGAAAGVRRHAGDSFAAAWANHRSTRLSARMRDLRVLSAHRPIRDAEVYSNAAGFPRIHGDRHGRSINNIVMSTGNTSRSSNGIPHAPLHGIRVLDLSTVVAGPFSSMILADLGADVIKVERLDGGDDSRGMGPHRAGWGAMFVPLNRGKRSITVDITTPVGREVILRLAEVSDVFILNFRGGKAAELGLDEESV